MTFSKLRSRTSIYPAFIGVSLLLGLIIPGFYEWTGSDQSRPSPLIGQFALGMIIGGVAICLTLPLLPIKSDAPEAENRRPLRFHVRTLLALTAATAICIAALLKFPMIAASVLCGGAFIHFAWFFARNPQHRWPASTLLACMSLPFVWIISYDELDNILQALLFMAAGFPMLLPSALIVGWFGHNFHESMWLSILLTGAELAIGTWLIGLGPKRTIAYLIVVTVVSVFSSFCFHALVLA
ncbi:hypothetical protein CA13_16050 [Planctomycetes bacterium CA13]|uniref:Uncharacterized protein n=1 Tax=Novipirellula herctigrandis TaxID=2527986 RepID=A0A5C5YYP9_9BACT|nr:hypothetical protein CA13_16050 [Planctomycetes bacterium CA13]